MRTSDSGDVQWRPARHLPTGGPVRGTALFCPVADLLASQVHCCAFSENVGLPTLAVIRPAVQALQQSFLVQDAFGLLQLRYLQDGWTKRQAGG